VTLSSVAVAQNVGIGTTTPNASALLDLTSTTSGFLPPRMTAAQRTAIASPATGLLVYQTDGGAGYYYYDGSSWTMIAAGSAGWSLTGNTGTVDGTHFIGTTDNVPLNFRVNNLRSGRIGRVGDASTFFGYQAGENDDATNNQNTFFGFQAGRATTTGNNNTANGYNALLNNTTASFNTAIGNNALLTQSFNNGGTTWNSFNVAIGADALFSNQPNATTNGIFNTAVGSFAARANTIGHSNISIGYQSLFSNTTASFNIAIGRNALFTQSFSNSGAVWSSHNIAIGFNALQNNQPTTTTNGNFNLAIGSSAPQTNTTGFNNVAIGNNALLSNTTGSSNTAIGSGADVGATGLTNATAIGANATVTASNSLVLGNGANVGIGNSAPTYNLSVNGTVQTGPGTAINLFRRTTTPATFTDTFDGGTSGVLTCNGEAEEGGFWANGNYAMIYSPGDNDLVKFADEDGFNNAGTTYDGGAMVARIDGSGNYYQVSDANRKENIVKVENGLEKVLALNGYTYQFKLLPKEVEKNMKPIIGAGVLAQELEKVLPEAVSNNDGHYMVSYAAITPLFIEAIKDQYKLVKELQSQNKSLENENRILTSKLSDLEQKI
ncbi:MAG: tail fiber domain-containing protein, partial [Bacteroidia bacterium]|nr:tail fiber domain-containing protein [Bacteroidia bacterium]